MSGRRDRKGGRRLVQLHDWLWGTSQKGSSARAPYQPSVPTTPARRVVITLVCAAGLLLTPAVAFSKAGGRPAKGGGNPSTATTTTTTIDPSTSTTTAPSTTAPTSTTTSTTAPATTSTTTTTTAPPSTTTTTVVTNSAPPARGGYFTMKGQGSWSSLPSGDACKSMVHSSTWEPRPDNTKRNNIMVDAAAAHASLSSRKRSTLGTYDPLWDSYLLARVDGQFTGTTDEIIQWAACKWGLSDDLVRAVAANESGWYQAETYASGRCVDLYGCGDWFGSEPYAARNTFCDSIATFGYDYQADYGDGLCPKTFSIIGEMSWWNPAWGFNWAGNQNGTFPFNRNSTAFALDYYGSQIRGCYEGWQWELGTSYTAGDLWGCVGAWYSGGWHDTGAEAYISHVQDKLNTAVWLSSSWPSLRPACSPTYGCPGPDKL